MPQVDYMPSNLTLFSSPSYSYKTCTLFQSEKFCVALTKK